MPEQEITSSEEIKTLKNNILEEKWYALYTRPRAEKLVFQRLIEEGIETFLPLQKTYRMWSDRKKLIEKPLLSSYVFVMTNKKFPKGLQNRRSCKICILRGTSSFNSAETDR